MIDRHTDAWRGTRFAAVGLAVVAAMLAVTGCTGARWQDWPQHPEEGYAYGVVYHDTNRNGARDPGEPGLRYARVSNGREIAVTDGRGRYRLPVTDDTIIFLIKPTGWTTPIDADSLPAFYYIHKPNGSPDSHFAGVEPTGPLPRSIDFPLVRQREPRQFKVLLLGDTQPSQQQQVDYLAHDVVEELLGTDAAFGFTLGDIVNDNLDMLTAVKRVVGRVGIPWHHVLGNHDMNYDAPDDTHSTETYQRVIGPPYYSFDYARVHFVVLDDVVWTHDPETGKGRYYGGLGERQLAFLRRDLALVPKDHLVVATMHIPLVDGTWDHDDRTALYDLLADRPHAVTFSAHYHFMAHENLDEERGWTHDHAHHHVVAVTACGSWWGGAPDELGIPHTTMRDGAPNGYLIAEFDGSDYSFVFKGARRPADHQMLIHTPEVVPVADLPATEVVVNFFVGNNQSELQMQLDGQGPWLPLTRVDDRPDPYYAALKAAEDTSDYLTAHRLPKAINSPHLWTTNLPEGLEPGVHVIEIQAVDMFGQRYTAHRLFRVE